MADDDIYRKVYRSFRKLSPRGEREAVDSIALPSPGSEQDEREAEEEETQTPSSGPSSSSAATDAGLVVDGISFEDSDQHIVVVASSKPQSAAAVAAAAAAAAAPAQRPDDSASDSGSSPSIDDGIVTDLHQPHTANPEFLDKAGILRRVCVLCKQAKRSARFIGSRRFCSSSCASKFSNSHIRRAGRVPVNKVASKHAVPPKRLRVPGGSPDKVLKGRGRAALRETARVVSNASPRKAPVQQRVTFQHYNTAQVAEFINSVPGCDDFGGLFSDHAIDGQALLMLTERHLLEVLRLPLGPALKILATIDGARPKRNRAQ